MIVSGSVVSFCVRVLGVLRGFAAGTFRAGFEDAVYLFREFGREPGGMILCQVLGSHLKVAQPDIDWRCPQAPAAVSVCSLFKGGVHKD